jgi:hypothetical protein
MALVAAGCPGGKGIPGSDKIPGGDAGKVDPSACGNYAQAEGGAKIKAFLEATVELQEIVFEAENYLKETCAMMASDLGVSAEGDTKTVCAAVEVGLKENLQVALKGGASLDIEMKPAVCEVNVDVAAKVAAECEGSASADVGVTCQGGCNGTCKGACDGTCAGGADGGGAGGDCNGECQGVCKGECSGSCDGHADVDASAACKADAEVEANAKAECTPPEVTVSASADVVADASKLENVKKALTTGLGRLASVQARAAKPLKAAVTSWASAVTELKGSVKAFGDSALCLSGQMGAAANLVGKIQGSLDVQVSFSASVSASATGSASGETAGL